MNLDHLNNILDTFEKPSVFDKDGNEIIGMDFRLPMSDEAVAVALKSGWRHRVVYKKDSKSKKLMPELVFDLPETQKI